MLKHYERSKDENGKYVQFGNQDIDPSRSHLNYNLGPEREGSQYGFIKERCAEVHCMNRKDVNVLGSWVVTAPEDLPEAELKVFFQKSYDYLEKKYGKENVVSAYVHMDESGRPHMHFAFVPVVLDQKRGGYKVNAKQCVTRKELLAFHPDLQKYLEAELGHPVAILNEATKDGNKTITELKRQREMEQQAKYAAETQEAREAAQKAQEELEAVKAALETQQAENEALRAQNEQLMAMIKDANERFEDAEMKADIAEYRLQELHETVMTNQKLMNEQAATIQEQAEQIDAAKEWMDQIPDWPTYEQTAMDAWKSLDKFKQLLQETFSSGWIFRNRPAERALLEAVSKLRDFVMSAISALKGFEIREKVPEEQQRSQVLKRGLDDMVRDAAGRTGQQQRIPGKTKDQDLEL